MTEELREGFEAWASLADLRKDDDIESAYEPVTESGCWITVIFLIIAALVFVAARWL